MRKEVLNVFRHGDVVVDRVVWGGAMVAEVDGVYWSEEFFG